MAQQMVAAAEEKETSLAERQYLLAETLEQQKRCEVLTQQETELRGQLSMYSDKFEEFQQTLTRSNQVFSTFKKDTDRVGVALVQYGSDFCKEANIAVPRIFPQIIVSYELVQLVWLFCNYADV